MTIIPIRFRATMKGAICVKIVTANGQGNRKNAGSEAEAARPSHARSRRLRCGRRRTAQAQARPASAERARPTTPDQTPTPPIQARITMASVNATAIPGRPR